MRFRQLDFCCRECGAHVPARIRRVGLTPLHQLVIHFWCVGCKRDIYIVKALADCWRECPAPEDEPDAIEPTPEFMREPDAAFLHSLGVAFPDDEPA
jgi:hypothetical protein